MRVSPETAQYVSQGDALCRIIALILDITKISGEKFSIIFINPDELTGRNKLLKYITVGHGRMQKISLYKLVNGKKVYSKWSNISVGKVEN